MIQIAAIIVLLLLLAGLVKLLGGPREVGGELAGCAWEGCIAPVLYILLLIVFWGGIIALVIAALGGFNK
jgi:hypothetical protein